MRRPRVGCTVRRHTQGFTVAWRTLAKDGELWVAVAEAVSGGCAGEGFLGASEWDGAVAEASPVDADRPGWRTRA